MERGVKKARFLKLLVYGAPGVGKTTLAATSLDVKHMKDVILINAESGDQALDGDLIDNVDDIFTVTVTTFKLLSRVHEFLKAHCKARDEDDGPDIDALRRMQASLTGEDEADIDKPAQFKTVIIDSLTEVEAHCFNQLLGVTHNTRIDEETDTAEFKEYKQNNGMILRLVRNFRDLPMHVIFICAEQYDKDETNKFKYTPDMTGKLVKKIQGFMDMVGYLKLVRTDTAGEVRRLHVVPSANGKFDAKHRYQTFKGKHFDNPTLNDMLKKIGFVSGKGVPRT